jgi:hypothetical protein
MAWPGEDTISPASRVASTRNHETDTVGALHERGEQALSATAIYGEPKRAALAGFFAQRTSETARHRVTQRSAVPATLMFSDDKRPVKSLIH